MTTIDLTPTFAEATAICIAILERSDNPDARRDAKLELMRYAEELDRLRREIGTDTAPHKPKRKA